MKYSFVLPAYKSRFFREAIDSILNQTYKEFELVIVNDASPEDLDSIVNSYDDNRIRYYVNEKNIGGKDLVEQWNHCLSYANGDYIILASDDDVYFPQYLEKMDPLVQKYPYVNVFRPRVQRIGAEGEISEVESYLSEFSTMLEFSYAWMRGYISSGIPFYVFNKKALETIGGFLHFPLAWFSDDATVLSLIKDKGIVVSPEVLFSFRVTGESISMKKNDSKTLELKLDATDMFYEWYEKYLLSAEPTNIYDEFYKCKVMYSLYNRRKNSSIIWLSNSTPVAILKNSRRVFTRRIVSMRILISILYHQLFVKRII